MPATKETTRNDVRLEYPIGYESCEEMRFPCRIEFKVATVHLATRAC